MPVSAGYRTGGLKSQLQMALAVEFLKDQVRDSSTRYIKLRRAVVAYLNATDIDRAESLRLLRHEVGHWEDA